MGMGKNHENRGRLDMAVWAHLFQDRPGIVPGFMNLIRKQCGAEVSYYPSLFKPFLLATCYLQREKSDHPPPPLPTPELVQSQGQSSVAAHPAALSALCSPPPAHPPGTPGQAVSEAPFPVGSRQGQHLPGSQVQGSKQSAPETLPYKAASHSGPLHLSHP